ncbi:hypothetical protein [Barrientosiimonas humi]|uniref:hypothetical protein n=1 Tax=Barrientosiimonas humi TaxID=999931 RepID=UPI00370D97A1
MSPAVAKLPDGGRSFGRVVGIIGDAGLATGNEYKAYSAPPVGADLRHLVPADGFGTGTEAIGPPSLDLLQSESVTTVWALGAGTLAVPGFAILIGASTIDLRRRSLRYRRAVTMGASKRDLALVSLKDMFPGIILGCFLASGALTFVTLNGVTLRVTEARYTAAEISPGMAPLMTAILIAAGTACAVGALPGVLSLSRRSRGRDIELAETPAKWGLVLFVLAFWVAVGGPMLLPPGQQPMIAYLVVVFGVGFGMSSVLSGLLYLGGGALRWFGRRHGRAGLIAGGSSLVARPNRLSRLLFPAGLAILLLGQGQLWTSLLGEQYYQGVQAQEAAEGRVAVSAPLRSLPSSGEVSALRRPGVSMVWLVTEQNGDAPSTTWMTTCADLAALSLPCTSGALPRTTGSPALHGLMSESFGRPKIDVATAPKSLSEKEVSIAIIGQDGPVDIAALNRRSAAALPGGGALLRGR